MLGIISLWLLFGFMAAGYVDWDAYIRGMNVFWWSIGVCFIPIIILPIYFIVRKPIKY